MEISPMTYGEIYVEVDGKKHLQSRVADKETLKEVLEELQGKPFDLHVITNRCIIGMGTYVSTATGLLTEHEDGACLGFLHRYLHE